MIMITLCCIYVAEYETIVMYRLLVFMCVYYYNTKNILRLTPDAEKFKYVDKESNNETIIIPPWLQYETFITFITCKRRIPHQTIRVSLIKSKSVPFIHLFIISIKLINIPRLKMSKILSTT